MNIPITGNPYGTLVQRRAKGSTDSTTQYLNYNIIIMYAQVGITSIMDPVRLNVIKPFSQAQALK